MSLNCIEIEEVIKSIPKKGVIRKFFQPDKFTLLISYFNENGEYYFYINVLDRYNYVCLIKDVDDKKVQNRFSEFLNANFEMSRIIDIYQYNMSRIVILELEKSGKKYKIVCRLWGSGANVILIDDNNIIVDCLRRFPKRSEWPLEEYNFLNIKSTSDLSYTIRKEFDKKDINKSVELYFKELLAKNLFFEKKDKLIKYLDSKILSLKNRLKVLDEKKTENEMLKNKKYADILLANIYLLKKGINEVELIDYENGLPVRIMLDKDISPKENIEKYYDKYKKIKNNLKIMMDEKKNILDSIEKLEKNLTLLHNSSNFEELFDIEKSIGLQVVLSKENKKKKSIGREFLLDDKFNAIVSRSDKEADYILSRVAKGNDYWFHVRDSAGSHVVVKNITGIQLTDRARLEACMLAVYYSKAKNEDYADVYFTRVKYLHKTKGGKAGLVFPTQEKNIKVKFDKAILENIIKNKILER